MNFLKSKKFRYGSVSIALTVIIIAAVILINAIFTALSKKYLWYIDMTSERMYTLTDDAKALLDTMNPEMEVEIILCTDKDLMESNSMQRYVLHTVLDIAERYDNVTARFVDIMVNPSAVNKFKDHTGQDIATTSVIVTSGGECRVYSLASLFTMDSDSTKYIGYNGEQRLVSGILAVTQVERPVAAITANHGEVENGNFYLLANLLDETGYDVVTVDLLNEDLPDNCRLVVVFDPKSDFKAGDALNSADELAKLDDFLDDRNSMMVFFDYETPVLPNLEEFLDEWGIAIARKDDANFLVRDTQNSLDAQSRYNIVGSYVEGGGLGASMTMKLTSAKVPKSVIFPYSTVIRSTYDDFYYDEIESWIGRYDVNGVNRRSYDVFTASSSAVAIAGEHQLSNKEVVALGVQDPTKIPFSLMKITRETFYDTVTGTETYSNVLACASTDFISSGALSSSYGNHSVLAYASSIMGRDTVSVSLDCKYFASTEISNITAAEANQYTVVLTVIPAAIIFAAGVFVMVRRKYA